MCMNKTIFHVHGPLCRHAEKEKEEAYILKAIEMGAERIIFTDHCPFPGNPFWMRMRMEEFHGYLAYLREMKAKYSELINVQIGLEAEWIPSYKEHYEMLKEEVDLLLLGQHFSLLSDGSYTFQSNEKIDEPRELAKGMIEGMESGYFSVVAHPDQIFRHRKTWGEEEERISNEIKECAVRTDVILEKNISNMRAKKKKLGYRPEFWADIPKYIQTIDGVDAHSVKEMEDNYLFQLSLTQDLSK